MSIFTDNLKKRLREEGVTYAAMSKAIGISKNGMKYWADNNVLPRSDVLAKIAEFLNTDIETLLAGEPKADLLSEEETELLSVFRALPLSGKRQLLGKAYELRDAAQKNAGDVSVAPPDLDVVTAVRGGMVNK